MIAKTMMLQATYHRNIVALLVERAATHPKRAAIRVLDEANDERTYSYRQLHDHAWAVASRIAPFTIPGDRVALLLPNDLDFAIGLLGCLYAGVVAAPACSPMREPGHAPTYDLDTLRQIEPRLALTTASELETASTLLQTTTQGRCRIFAIDGIHPRRAPALTCPLLSPESVAFLQPPSGATGVGDAVPVTHRELLANTCARATDSAMQANDALDQSLPVEGRTMVDLLATLCAGSSVVFRTRRATVRTAERKATRSRVALPLFAAKTPQALRA